MGLSELILEELALFILAAIGFSLFLFREKQIIDCEEEKIRMQREINRISKDLTNSYSYIGESNRKFDILKAIVMGISNANNISQAKETSLYKSILSAVEVMTKSKNIALRFVEKPKKVLREVRTNNRIRLSESDKACFDRQHAFVENDKFIIARCPNEIGKIRACIVIEKQPGTKRIEDPQLLKALAALAAFLYVYIQNSKKDMVKLQHLE